MKRTYDTVFLRGFWIRKASSKPVGLFPSGLKLHITRVSAAICLLFTCRAGHGAQALGCGQSLSASIAAASQTQSYTFLANPGEIVLLSIYGQPGFPAYFNAVADVYDSNLSLAWSVTNGGWKPKIITTGGKYTVVVHADNYANTGGYGMSLAFVTGRCGVAPGAMAQPGGAITQTGQFIPYAFTGNTGDTVNFSVYGQPGFPAYFNAVARLFNPQGTEVASWTNGPSGLLHLTNSGTYTITISADNLANSGNYTVSVVPLATAPAPVGEFILQTNHAAELIVWGQLGNPTTIQYVTELNPTNVWITLTNLTLSWSPSHYIDWSSTNAQRRFYRQVQRQ